MYSGHSLRVRWYKVLCTSSLLKAPQTMISLSDGNGCAECCGVALLVAFFAGGEVAEVVSEDHVIPGLVFNDEVILLHP